MKINNNMKWNEKLKLGIARMLLITSDKLLGRNPKSFDIFLSQKAKEEQEKRLLEVKIFEEKQAKNIVNDIEEVMIRHRDIDFDFSNPEEKSDALVIFHAELEALVIKHLTHTSGLVIAGPLVAEAMKLYRTLLPQEEYDHIVSHIYQTRNSIETILLPQDLASKTVH